jgi:hypothetical protein
MDRQSTTTRWRVHLDDKEHQECCEDRKCPRQHHFYEPFYRTVLPQQGEK